jgi:hypothetical protein
VGREVHGVPRGSRSDTGADVWGVDHRPGGHGVGAVFNLGKTNTVDAISKLVGSMTSSMLMVDNNGAGTALDLKVGSAAECLSLGTD